MKSYDVPYVEALPSATDPTVVFDKLSHQPHCLFLDSALKHNELGRYSYVCADPFAFLRIEDNREGGFDRVEQVLAQFKTHSIDGLPPFQGGVAGLLSYDLAQSLERITPARHDEFKVPALAMGLYDVVVAFDHHTDEAWIISHGFSSDTSEDDLTERATTARRRSRQFREWIKSDAPTQTIAPVQPIDLAGPIHQSDRLPQLSSNFSHGEYLKAVQRVVDYIRAGDAFQVNLAQRLTYPAADDSPSLYRRLRTRNPATFAGYFDLGDFQIVSASPERFLRVADRTVETRPIKGTRRRATVPEADMFSGRELRESEKDMAENVMIVDLMRNDLSRVCEPDSVRVEQLCKVESYEYVQHLVSSVTGRLADEYGPVDLLRASFPGGSITGAPKVRAMEIIAEIEPHARGAYCGSLGFIGFNGAMDFSILIRTITAGGGWWQLPVGGGVVAQSKPQAEYEETWHKAEGMLRALLK